MNFTRDQLASVVAVLDAEDRRFRNLIRVAGLDPRRGLVGADLRGVDFGEDDYAGFDFARADLRGADLGRARGVRPEMVRGARWDETTNAPPGLFAATKPSWAADMGWDEFGPWATFSVPAPRGRRVTQRMRWCAPGRFLMGSPADEPGRYDDEGPLHEVTIADGFWLMETPCTQALWRAVMGGNPSRFKSPTRPVERVSFDDVAKFLTRIEALVPGLGLSLPSEARWEYACRAGTATATYAGAVVIEGDYNAPVLDAIAWYGGNSGEGFELKNGEDSSGWSGKQYPHTRAGTRPVGLKRPNAWGLHDMLGNVWEWCADTWHPTYDGAPSDGSAWIEYGAASRVVRGGAWDFRARSVRAAYRSQLVPADRYVSLGFRCARVQGSNSGAVGAGWGGASVGAERPEAATTGLAPTGRRPDKEPA